MNENFIIKTISVIHWLNSFGACGVALKWWTPQNCFFAASNADETSYLGTLSSVRQMSLGVLTIGTSKTHMHILYIRTYINLYIYIHIHTVYIYMLYTVIFFSRGNLWQFSKLHVEAHSSGALHLLHRGFG